MDYQQKILELLLDAAKQNASDLHISVGRYPTLRIDGELISLTKEQIVSPELASNLLTSILTTEQKETLAKHKDVDFSFSIEGKARFRANVFYQKGYLSGAFRYIPAKIRTVEELNLPKTVHEFARFKQGFVLIVGPAGMGKSTTLAALLDEINHNNYRHIITIEEPIEYLFTQDRSLVDQREIGRDSLSWHRALRSTLRQDPDVIMIGEMRDPESISIAITAAETGHLVFSTLHTNSASQTIDRIIDSFPPAQQNQIRIQLASALVGIVSQRLIPRTSGGRVPSVEILFSNPAVRNLIREEKVYQIDMVIETGIQESMVSLNRSLANLVKSGQISLENAEKYSLNPVELKYLIEQGG